MGKFVGIDLGTTNSVAAFKMEKLEVVTAPDNTPTERKLTRSVVALKDNRIVVGNDAYFQLKADPENVIISIKRLIGRGFGDSVVQKQLDRFAYKIGQSTKGTENSLSVWLGGKEYEPEDISAEILKKVVQNAQTYQEQQGRRERITQAVITIPAYFNDKQRHATQIAATRAGLKGSELLPEPTAAAISYGFKPNSDDVKTILVYDFGGGTFDSSIVTSAGNQFIESGKAGDLWLGGDDIDDRIIDFVKQQVAEAEDLDDIDGLIAKMPHYQRVRFLGDLKMAVEQAKIQLSSNPKASIMPSTPLLDDLGMAIEIDVEITREQFEEMILPLVERSISVCKDAIKYSDYPEDMIDVVLLVGGSSQIPLVQQKVKEAFGAEKVVVHPRPMYAVAEGAAIVAAGLVEKVGTVSRDYCIELIDNPRHKLIKQGDILPVKTTHTFRTEANGQSLIHFKFYSPDDVSKRDDERIGDMWLALDKPYPKATEVLVTAELDEKNGSLQTTAVLKNDPSVKVSCSLSTGGEDESISGEVEETIQQLNKEGNLTEVGVKEAYRIAGETVRAANQIKTQDGNIQQDRVQAAKEKSQELKRFADDDYDTAEFYVRYFEFITNDCGFLIPSSQKERLETLCRNLKDAIARHRKGEMQKLLEDAKRELKNLPESVQLILVCRDGVARAHQIEPNHARVLAGKLSQMIDAMRREDGYEAQRLFEELAKGIEPYITQPLPTSNNSIATGLTR
ncbi:MAG: Hsp70 family protein [Xenococcaceae cyanobacterium MO_167.B27]|nr:Hsp70 family protein [Xenococcaceae cyanobacterium MO_167.B27]